MGKTTSANPNRATNVAVTIEHADGESTARVNQRKIPPIDESFLSLGKFPVKGGESLAITVSNAEADGHVIADAVQLLPVR